jgi:hypothetical protein
MKTSALILPTWRKRVREAHARASAGCQQAVEDLRRLVVMKRNGRVAPAKTRKPHDDAKFMQAWAESKGNSNTLALKMGISRTTALWRLRKLKAKGLLILSLLGLGANAQPVPTLVAIPAATNGSCQPLLWDYPTNAIGGTNAAGFVVAWGLNTNALTNEVWWGLSTLTQSPVTNGSVTFSNAVCGLWLTNTYWYRARTYTAANTTSIWWSTTIGIAPKTNLWIQLANQYAPTPAGPWTEDPASIRNLTNVALFATNSFLRTRFSKTPF